MKLICTFVFTYAVCWFSHAEAQFFFLLKIFNFNNLSKICISNGHVFFFVMYRKKVKKTMQNSFTGNDRDAYSKVQCSIYILKTL